MSTSIGYSGVSTTDQKTDTQVEKLKAAGCAVIRREKVSGRSRDGREELATVMEFIRPGDVLAVVKLDRLGRNTRDVLNLVHELHQKGAHLRVLEPAITTDGPMGEIMLTVFGMVAQMGDGVNLRNISSWRRARKTTARSTPCGQAIIPIDAW